MPSFKSRAAFSLTAKQIELRDAAAGKPRHVLAYGGSRSGKTMGFCYCIATRALMAPESRHLICRRHNVDVRQSVMMDTWPKMMRAAYPAVALKWNKTDQVATFSNGAEVWFGGLDDKERVEKILGKEFVTIYPNEVSQIAYETVLTLRTRLAQNVRKEDGRRLALKMYYDLNPTGRSHWSYREFVENVRPENGMPIEAGSRAHVVLNPSDNPHLPREYLTELAGLPERQRQRFLDGKYLLEMPGTLWPQERIEALRCGTAPDLTRIVVAVDPSGSDGSGGDAQGIIIVGRGVDGHGYVIEDASCKLGPLGWGRRASQAYHRHKADLLVAEANFGGAMVEMVMRTADPHIAYRAVNASRGKHVRAEPIAALYEQGKVHHVGNFPALEEQMVLFTTAGFQGAHSPDRADALVWALSELMLGDPGADLWIQRLDVQLAQLGVDMKKEEPPHG